MEADAVRLMLRLDGFLLEHMQKISTASNYRDLWRIYAVYSSDVHVILSKIPAVKLANQKDELESLRTCLKEANKFLHLGTLDKVVKFFDKLTVLDPELLKEVASVKEVAKEVTGASGDDPKHRTGVFIGGSEVVDDGGTTLALRLKTVDSNDEYGTTEEEVIATANLSAEKFSAKFEAHYESHILGQALSQASSALGSLRGYVGSSRGPTPSSIYKDLGSFVAELSRAMDLLDARDAERLKKMSREYKAMMDKMTKEEMKEEKTKAEDLSKGYEIRKECKDAVREAVRSLKGMETKGVNTKTKTDDAGTLRATAGSLSDARKKIADMEKTLHERAEREKKRQMAAAVELQKICENIYYIVSKDVTATCILKTLAKIKGDMLRTRLKK